MNDYLKPPLLKDLNKILDYKYLSINKSKDGPLIAKTFKDLLKITSKEGDVEEFFTLFLQTLELIRCNYNPHHVFFTKSQIDQLIKCSTDDSDFDKIRIILKYFSDKPEIQFCAPLNFYNFFQDSLREYIRDSLKSNYCVYHEKLFKNLDSHDTIVTFNYDEICDFTLYKMGKLNRSSFDGLGFTAITFPEELTSSEGIKLLKLHGSFNWWTDIASPYKNVYYNLDPQESSKKRRGDIFFRVILPFYLKDRIYCSYDIYKSHIIQFGNKLKNAEEIILVGKNFDNADKELNSLIEKWSSLKKKKIKIINLSLDNYFIKYHCKLFNAKYEIGWNSLEEFYTSSNDL